MQDRFHLYTSFGLSTILAVVIGCSYVDLPLTSAGAFTRASVIFIALLTTCLDAFGEVCAKYHSIMSTPHISSIDAASYSNDGSTYPQQTGEFEGFRLSTNI